MILLPRSPRLLINPAHADLLRRAGLHAPRDLLHLREEIISGHPDRQVSRVEIAGVTCYLKREHRVPWRERLRNLLSGFGLASKSWREAQLLRSLSLSFDGCPEWIAAAELPDGQAFVLVREVAGAVPLPRLLEVLRHDPERRRRLAGALGEALGRLHAAGAVHGDLYANHVLVISHMLRPVFLDWQRAKLKNRQCWRDLAALAVTLPSDTLTRGDLLAFLRAYRTTFPDIPLSQALNLDAVRQEVQRLSQRRHIRAKATVEGDGVSQSLLCLDGDALRVTAGFRSLWPEALPAFLLGIDDADCEIALPDGGTGRLIRRCHRLSWWQRCGSARRAWTSPERLQMNLLNRLERFGIEAPRVLAAGERPLSGNRVCAFLLTRLPPDATPLDECACDPQAGTLLARLHEAGCFFRNGIIGLGMTPRGLVLLDAAGLTIRRRFRSFWRARDLRRLGRGLRIVQGG